MEINVNVTGDVDLAQKVGVTRRREYDPDGDWSYVETDQTLADLVAERLVDKLMADSTAAYEMRRKVAELRDQMIAERLSAVIDATFDQILTLTDGYGRQKGEPVSFTDQVLKEAAAYFNKPAERYSQTTRAQELVRDVVRREMEKELRAVVAAAKAQAVEAVKAKAAEFIAQQITAGVR